MWQGQAASDPNNRARCGPSGIVRANKDTTVNENELQAGDGGGEHRCRGYRHQNGEASHRPQEEVKESLNSSQGRAKDEQGGAGRLGTPKVVIEAKTM